METKTAAVSMRNVTKTFGSVIANDKVNLDIYKGEILSLLGENGSGKTTLMNMLSGIYFPDEGQIFINGKEEVIRSPKDAFDLGIGMVHQHFKLIDVLSATENIILGLPGKLNLKEATKKVEEICQKYGFEVDPKQKIYDMSVSQKQTVEIVKVLYRGADILILDEPTAVLTPQETEKLFRVLRKMRDDGKAIVIITHKMHEVESLSDRVAVLPSGQYIGCMKTKDTNVTEMTNMMVGHTVTLNIDRPDPVNPKPRIEVEGLTVRNEEGVVKLQDVSFTANSGEILGIAGISGCGQKELLEAIAGLQVTEAGTIAYVEDDGSREMLIGMDPKKIAELGVSLSFVPEHRLGMGLVGNMDLADKIREIIELNQKSITQGGQIVELKIPGTLYIYADEVKIGQVITNFLTNALKHTAAGQHITIQAYRKPDEETMHFEICDDGEGIPESELPYVWDRYHKTSRSFSRNQLNTGLGLAIVKAILDAHDAQYGVMSIVGKGSTFWFELRETHEA